MSAYISCLGTSYTSATGATLFSPHSRVAKETWIPHGTRPAKVSQKMQEGSGHPIQIRDTRAGGKIR